MNKLKEILKSLNGWHRIFLVFTLIWIAITGNHFASNAPDLKNLEIQIEIESNALASAEISRIRSIADPAKKHLSHQEICEAVAKKREQKLSVSNKQMPWDGMPQLMSEALKNDCTQYFNAPSIATSKTNISEVMMEMNVRDVVALPIRERLMNDELPDFRKRQLDHLLKTIIFLIGGPLILYAVGAIISWVRDGFARK